MAGHLFAVVPQVAGLMLIVTTIAYLIASTSVERAMFEVPILVRWIGAIAGLFGSALRNCNIAKVASDAGIGSTQFRAV